jgi:hypothetical protein
LSVFALQGAKWSESVGMVQLLQQNWQRGET